MIFRRLPELGHDISDVSLKGNISKYFKLKQFSGRRNGHPPTMKNFILKGAKWRREGCVRCWVLRTTDAVWCPLPPYIGAWLTLKAVLFPILRPYGQRQPLDPSWPIPTRPVPTRPDLSRPDLSPRVPTWGTCFDQLIFRPGALGRP